MTLTRQSNNFGRVAPVPGACVVCTIEILFSSLFSLLLHMLLSGNPGYNRKRQALKRSQRRAQPCAKAPFSTSSVRPFLNEV